MFKRRFFRFAFPVAAFADAAFLLSGCARRCGWHHGPEARADWIAKKLGSKLDLDAAQKARLDTLKASVLARRAEFRAVHAGLKDLLLAEIRAEQVDSANLNQALGEREAKLRELRGFLVGAFAEFHAMLTPAQREKLAGWLERRDRRCR